jgi:hypothetical protein
LSSKLLEQEARVDSNKQTGDVCMWRRDTENKDIEHQESDRELITINETTNSIQAISQISLNYIYI